MRALIYNSSQAEQSGMRTYFTSADTQEDMNAWVRAMNQAAQVLSLIVTEEVSPPWRVPARALPVWEGTQIPLSTALLSIAPPLEF